MAENGVRNGRQSGRAMDNAGKRRSARLLIAKEYASVGTSANINRLKVDALHYQVKMPKWEDRMSGQRQKPISDKIRQRASFVFCSTCDNASFHYSRRDTVCKIIIHSRWIIWALRARAWALRLQPAPRLTIINAERRESADYFSIMPNKCRSFRVNGNTEANSGDGSAH